MRVDHVSYAAEHDGLKATAERLAKQIGVEPVDGGIHPRFGTRNVIFPLAHERYVEVVEVLDHPASDKAPVRPGRARPLRGRRRLARLGGPRRRHRSRSRRAWAARRSPATGTAPTAPSCRWRQLGVKGLISDPQLPFFVEWETPECHPSDGAHTDVTIEGLQIAGDPDRVREWLGLPPDMTSTVIDFTFVAPHGTPGLLAVTFDTPKGKVTV